MEWYVYVAIAFVVVSFVVGKILSQARAKKQKTSEQEYRSSGELGEDAVQNVIGDTVEGEQYVLNNLFLGTDSHSAEIDHVVINPRGVFVIETKNLSGDIYGTEHDAEWTQVLADGDLKHTHRNPIKQNAVHARRVKELVGNVRIFPLVVMVQNNTRHIEASNVIGLRHLRTVLERGEDVLSPMQMAEAYYILKENSLDITADEHIRNCERDHN